MYKHIREHVQEAKKKDEKILITGDFNCKIGTTIKGNREEVSKSGKILKEMILKQELTILNTSPKCEGKWTRIEGETKTILEYVITDVADEESLISMKIDEDKIITPYTITGTRMIHSDHCAITATLNWLIRDKKEAKEETYSLSTSKKNLQNRSIQF